MLKGIFTLLALAVALSEAIKAKDVPTDRHALSIGDENFNFRYSAEPLEPIVMGPNFSGGVPPTFAQIKVESDHPNFLLWLYGRITTWADMDKGPETVYEFRHDGTVTYIGVQRI